MGETETLGAVVSHTGRLRRGSSRCWWLIRARRRRVGFRPVELTETQVQLVQFRWKWDAQLLVKGQSSEPVLQFLERWTKGRSREECDVKPDWQGWKQDKTRWRNLATEAWTCTGTSRLFSFRASCTSLKNNMIVCLQVNSINTELLFPEILHLHHSWCWIQLV